MEDKHERTKKLLGLYCRQLREKKGYTQQYVADVIGGSASYYSKIENGRANPTLIEIVDLLGVLGVSLSDFLKTLLCPPDEAPANSEAEGMNQSAGRLTENKQEDSPELKVLKDLSRDIQDVKRKLYENEFPYSGTKPIIPDYDAQGVRYALQQKHACLENRYYISYGLRVHIDETFMFDVDDLSSDRQKVQDLVDAFNQGNLSLLHLSDAIEDFLS